MKIKIYCDGKSCVDILNKGGTSTNTDDLEKAEHDIIVAIFKIIEEFEDVKFEWCRVIKMMMTTHLMRRDHWRSS